MSDVRSSALALQAELENAGAIVENGLYLPPDLPYERYEAIGLGLRAVNALSAFLIGDWLLYGEHTYGEKYAQAASLLGYSPQTLANYASVAKRIPPSRRRPESVTFSIHAEVASLPPEEQTHWLQVAAEESLTREELRQRLRPKELPAPRTVTCPHCGKEFPL